MLNSYIFAFRKQNATRKYNVFLKKTTLKFSHWYVNPPSPDISDQYDRPEWQVTTPGVDDYLGFTVSDSAFSWIVRKILEFHIIIWCIPTPYGLLHLQHHIDQCQFHVKNQDFSRLAVLALVRWLAPTPLPSSPTALVQRSPVAFLSLPYSSLLISCLLSLPTSSWSWWPGWWWGWPWAWQGLSAQAISRTWSTQGTAGWKLACHPHWLQLGYFWVRWASFFNITI